MLVYNEKTLKKIKNYTLLALIIFEIFFVKKSLDIFFCYSVLPSHSCFDFVIMFVMKKTQKKEEKREDKVLFYF